MTCPADPLFATSGRDATTNRDALQRARRVFRKMQPKTIAILSSGPSLRLFDPSERFDLRIGVNRAATVHACDWWSVGDQQAFWRHLTDPDNERHGMVIGRPRVITMSDTWGGVQGANRALFNEFPEWMTWEKLRDTACPPQEWDCYSSTIALVLAGHLGGAGCQITAFGCDMGGLSDFAGYTAESRFNDIRWENERRIWTRLVDWLGETFGIVTRRIVAQEALSNAA